jgi:hypothetical protein
MIRDTATRDQRMVAVSPHSMAAIVSVATVIGAILGALLTQTYSNADSDLKMAELNLKKTELYLKMVEIGFGILRAEPKPGDGAIREWAIDLVNRNSYVPFSSGAHEALQKQALPWKAPATPRDGREP